MKLSEYVAQHGDTMFMLRPQDGPARIYVYGSDPARGVYTPRGWETFAAAADRALTQGCTHIAHNTWPDGTIHTDLIPLERETPA